jgi:hypothetical protein
MRGCTTRIIAVVSANGMRTTLCLLLLCLSSLSGCKKDFEEDGNPPAPPETFMVVDQIQRSGSTRLTTTIEAHWWGYSENGILSGFEVSTDGMQTWSFTKDQSGSFLLSIPPGQDTADVVVYVRSIDNEGQKDPTPASSAFPIRNSRPGITLDYSRGRKNTTFPAFRIYWSVNDTDGIADVQEIQVSFNDTDHVYSVPGNTDAITLVDEPGLSGQFSVYQTVGQNTKSIPLPGKLTNIVYDSLNFFYVRSVDRAGAKALWRKDSVFVRKPKSGILLINDYTSSKNIPNNFYLARLAAIGVSSTQVQSVFSVSDELPTEGFVIKKAFGFFNRLIWFSNNPEQTLPYVQQNTVDFFSAGGRMLMSIDVGGTYPFNSTTLSFTPASTFVIPPTGRDFRMAPGDSLVPVAPGYPAITYNGSGISNAYRPFEMQSPSSLYEYDSLYVARLTSIGGSDPPSRWPGNSLVIAKRTKTGDTHADLVFATVPLHLMNGNSQADSLFRKLAVEELDF